MASARILGAYLQTLRDARRKSLSEVGDALGVSKFLVADWEAERCRIPASALDRLLDALNADDEQRLVALDLAGKLHGKRLRDRSTKGDDGERAA